MPFILSLAVFLLGFQILVSMSRSDWFSMVLSLGIMGMSPLPIYWWLYY